MTDRWGDDGEAEVMEEVMRCRGKVREGGREEGGGTQVCVTGGRRGVTAVP